jgi:hypothetical protein
MEELTKTQLILLALLVSFVTSMATGIVTVTLMDQAPEPVVQTINRIVERTVETVREAVPVPDKSPRQSVVTKETTVVVKEEDLITSTIEKNSRSLVRISATVGTSSPEEVFAGLGVIIGADGLVAADAASFPRDRVALRASLSDNTTYMLTTLPNEAKRGVLLLRIGEPMGVPENEPTPTPKLQSVIIADASALKLGQTVIALGGRSRTSVALGVISSLITGEAPKEGVARATTTAERQPSPTIERLETTLVSGDILPGTPVFNIFGELVAIAVAPQGGATRHFIAAGEVSRLLAATRSGVSLDTR